MANQVVYGFHTLTSVFNERVTTVGVDKVNTAIDVAFADHNERLNRMLALFVREVDNFKTTFSTDFVVRNQPLDEHGRVFPIQGGQEYEVAFPLQESGNAIGYTYTAFQYVTVEEVNRKIRSILIGDMRWMFDHILGALFADATYPWWSKQTGELTIQPLASGDATTYNLISGADSAATDDHIIAQAAAIADATNPFDDIYTDLAEHPENGASPTVISFIASDLKATTQALATFYDVVDNDIRRGTANDELVGTLGVAHPGTLLGKEAGGAWVVEYPSIPSGYILSVAVGGEEPLGMRQHEPANLRGFVEIEPTDGSAAERMPYLRRDWFRGAGFGAWNRVGARVDRIGNGTYAVPAGLTVPMP